jgi:hypothetical protein
MFPVGWAPAVVRPHQSRQSDRSTNGGHILQVVMLCISESAKHETNIRRRQAVLGEDGSGIFLRNVGISPNYMLVQHIIPDSSSNFTLLKQWVFIRFRILLPRAVIGPESKASHLLSRIRGNMPLRTELVVVYNYMLQHKGDLTFS